MARVLQGTKGRGHGLRIMEDFLFEQCGLDGRARVQSLLVEEAEVRLGEGVVLDDPADTPSWTGRSMRGTEAGCEVKVVLGIVEEDEEVAVVHSLLDVEMNLPADPVAAK